LRRLSERLDRESARIYSALGAQFEQRWYGILNQIVLNGPMTVGEIAASLRVTHVSVSQARRSLEAAGFVHSLNDAQDARRRPIALTLRGKALVTELTPLWQALGDSAEELNAEAGDVVALLDRLDDALDARSLFDRANARMDTLVGMVEAQITR
jgi:DNA-binding MarR family transcriptional regulator